MLDEIRSVLRQVGGAEKLRNVLAMSDASTKLFLFLMMFGVARGFVG
jgi:hypothetical protein